MTAPEAELRRVWRRVVGADHDELVDALLARHREPHRRYHTATHVMWVCRHVQHLATAHPVADLDAVLAAALYHDVVYDPTAPAGQNEHASAQLAGTALARLGWSNPRVATVIALIEATASHEPPPGVDPAAASVLLDADLAVLGADPAAYQAYVTGVRAEYAHVPEPAWRTGRAAVLDTFLSRPRLFLTDTMHAERHSRAQANLAAERASLGRHEVGEVPQVDHGEHR